MLSKLESLRKKFKSLLTKPNNVPKIGNFVLIIVTLMLGLSGLFKIFGGSFAESFYTTLNVESFYRIRIGFIEIISVSLLWFNRTSQLGFYLILCLMGGAVAVHIVTSTPGLLSPVYIGIFTFIGLSIKKHGLKVKDWF